MPGRSFTGTTQYRYGFNGKEMDNEVYGQDNVYDYGFRIYNPRIGRFLSVDPLTVKYPELTPYQYASNMPIIAVDLDGEEAKIIIYHGNNGIVNTAIHTFTSWKVDLHIVKSEVITIHRVRVNLPNGKTEWKDVNGIFPNSEIPVNFQTGRIDAAASPSLFTEAIKIVLKNEGGWKNEPKKDKGDPTNMGITWPDWQEMQRKF